MENPRLLLMVLLARNVFNMKKGDEMFLAPKDRVIIW
jgi:hypothetical protein